MIIIWECRTSALSFWFYLPFLKGKYHEILSSQPWSPFNHNSVMLLGQSCLVSLMPLGHLICSECRREQVCGISFVHQILWTDYPPVLTLQGVDKSPWVEVMDKLCFSFHCHERFVEAVSPLTCPRLTILAYTPNPVSSAAALVNGFVMSDGNLILKLLSECFFHIWFSSVQWFSETLLENIILFYFIVLFIFLQSSWLSNSCMMI